MKKVFLALMAVAVIALTGCEVKKSDVLVKWEVEGPTTLSQGAVVKEIMACYDQAAIDQGYTIIMDHMILLSAQRNLDNAVKVGAAIADAAKAAVEAKKINIPFAHLIVNVNADGNELLGSRKVGSIEYGLASNPDAKRGVNVTVTLAKFFLDFNDVTLYIKNPGDNDFNKVALNFVEKEQVTTDGELYTVYEAVYEKELTTKGEGKYYIELKRNDKQFEEDVKYVTNHPFVGCVAGYLGERENPSVDAGIVLAKGREETFLTRHRDRLAEPKTYNFE